MSKLIKEQFGDYPIIAELFRYYTFSESGLVNFSDDSGETKMIILDPNLTETDRGTKAIEITKDGSYTKIREICIPKSDPDA